LVRRLSRIRILAQLPGVRHRPPRRSPIMMSECRIIDLPKIDRREGNITPVEGGNHIPFDIARVYYMYDIPGGQSRGGHAHKRLEQLIVAAMGSFDVVVDNGKNRRTFHLDRAYYGLYVPRMMWRELV